MSKWAKIIIEIVKDIAIAFLINGTMISIPAAIQQKVTPDFDKFFGMIEMGVYEWIAIFLSSTALLLYFKRKWVKKYLDEFIRHLDEFTGKAKAEREYRKWLELENRKEIERKEAEDKKEIERIEKATKEIEKRNQYIELLKQDFNCHFPFNDQDKKYFIAKSIEILRELGFVVPSNREQSLPSFEDLWHDFLGKAIACVEIGTEKQNLRVWREILLFKKYP